MVKAEPNTDGGDVQVGNPDSPAEHVPPVQPRKRKRRVRRLVIATLLGAGLMALAQSVAPATDHAISNIVTAVVAVITVLFVTYQLHRMARDRGFSFFVVPVAGLALLALLALLFRVDGFSGSMVPQLKLRFASRVPEMRTLEDAGAVEPTPDISTGMPSPAAFAQTSSLGFLGSQRTGVIKAREFTVPESEADAELLWNQGLGAGWSSFSVVDDRAITLEQRDELECLTCYRLLDGKLLWMVEHHAIHQNPLGGVGPRSTPTIHNELVYAQGATGRLWCVNWQTGETVWTVDLLELAGWDQAASEAAIAWGRSGSPLLVDDLCVVPFGAAVQNSEAGRSLIALDALTGETRWRAGSDQISYASPALLTLAGVQQIVSVNEQTISGHALQDGETLWEFPWVGQSNGGANCAMVVPAGENRFLIGKGYGGGSALVEITNGEAGAMRARAVWESVQVLKTKFTHACVDGEVAYGISNGSLEAVAIADGEPLWKQSRRLRWGEGQAILVEDILVGQTEAGGVVFAAADPLEYRELIRLPALESKTWNIPTIAGRHLLVRNDRQAFCFLLPPR